LKILAQSDAFSEIDKEKENLIGIAYKFTLSNTHTNASISVYMYVYTDKRVNIYTHMKWKDTGTDIQQQIIFKHS
jgi:hypothetical protein